jgi:hypothetical protein
MNKNDIPYSRFDSPCMRKIDGLSEWTSGFSFLSYGVSVGIRSNQPELLERVVEHLPPGVKFGGPRSVDYLYSICAGGAATGKFGRRLSLLYRDFDLLARGREVEGFFDTLESDLRMNVADASSEGVFIHAGAVGWRGKAIVIPGCSFSGKSTLVAEFVRAGADYYSDEFAVLDRRGRVHAFPKPLSLRYDDSGKQTDISAEELGGRVGSRPLPVALVLLSQYREGARWRPRQLTPGRGALEMLKNTVSARRHPDVALQAIHQVASRATVLKSNRGEAARIAELVLDRLIGN